jgi:hypothetical protein
MRCRFTPPWSVKKVNIRVQDDGDMLALSDSQLRALWEAAAGLPIEKRGIFLMRLVAQLQLRSHFTTADLDDAVRFCAEGPDPKIRSLMAARRFPPPWFVEELDPRENGPVTFARAT